MIYYGNNHGLAAIEAAGYPISVFERVQLADVDNKMYFNENIDFSIKSITYYDKTGDIAKKEFYTYRDGNDKTAIKRIYSSFGKDFKGVWNKDAEPSDLEYGSFYYIEGTCTINGIVYSDMDVLGKLDGSFEKCKFDSNGKMQRGGV